MWEKRGWAISQSQPFLSCKKINYETPLALIYRYSFYKPTWQVTEDFVQIFRFLLMFGPDTCLNLSQIRQKSGTYALVLTNVLLITVTHIPLTTIIL